jgi:hypothetical protein
MVHLQHVQQQQLLLQQQQEGGGERRGDAAVAAAAPVQAQPHLLFSDPLLLRLLFEALASEGPVQAMKVAEALGRSYLII